jgi:diguanylate cyclase (GGDEF)-like protein/hemerythrin-like metal-binding protein
MGHSRSMVRLQGQRPEESRTELMGASQLIPRQNTHRPRMAWAVAVALTLVVVGDGDVSSSAAPPLLRNWDQAAGLPQATVSSLAQTDDGLLWVGTYGGLARFDGLSFRTLALEGDVPFEGLRVTCLLTDPGGTLWVGTDHGLVRMRQGRLERVSLPLLESPHVTALFRDRRGTIWVATDGHGVFRNGGSGFDPEARLSAELGTDAALVLGEDERGRLVLGTRSGSLKLLEGGRVRTLATLPGHPLSAGPIYARGQDLLVGSYQGSLYRWTSASGLRPLPGSPQGIRTIYREPSGTVWIAGDSGMGRLDGDQVRSVDWGLPSGAHVFSILRDREGTLWVGSEVRGLFQEAHRWFTTIGTAQGLPGSSVRGLAGLSDGSVLAAVACEAVTRIFPDGRVSNHHTGPHCPFAVLASRTGRIIVGTYDGPLYDLSLGSGAAPLDLPVRNVVALHEDSDGRLWLGTRTDGAYVLDHGILRHLAATRGVPDIDVRFFAEDSLGRVWMATGAGVAREEGERFVPVGLSEGLPEVETRCVAFDDEITWIGTYGRGLAGRIAGQERFTVLDTRRGLTENVVSRIWRDGAWVWWTGNRGVYRALHGDLVRALRDPSTLVYPQRFGVADGLATDETSGGFQPSDWRAPDGSLWFPTVQGVAILAPRSPDAGGPPVARIDRVLVDGKAAAPIDDRVRLSARAGRIEIDFLASSLASPRRTHFLTRLVGLDADWVPQGAARRVEYARLDPGRYTFEVVAVGESGETSREPATVTLVQAPALRDTWPFRLGVALMLFLLGAGAYALRTRATRQRAHELKQLVGERTSELQEVNRRLAAAVEDLERVASTDKLTGAWNRRRWAEVARIETERARRTRQPLSLVMLDIDHFKEVNDRHGHAVGDQVLAEVARITMASLRSLDLLARWGGEEFLLLMPGAGLSEASAIADRLRVAIEGHDFGTAGHLTVSLGVAEWVRGGSLSEWVARVDAALYRAKDQGRNCVRWDPAVARVGRPGTTLGELRWHASFASGDPDIDAEHEELFATANILIQAVLAGAERTSLVETTRLVVERSAEHFRTEEQLLERRGYPGLAGHKADHATLIARARELVDRLDSGHVSIDTILWFLAYDLVAWHILTSDRLYFPLFQKKDDHA